MSAAGLPWPWRGTHLALDVAALIVAVGRRPKRGARLVAPGNAAALCEVLLALCPADLDLLLLAAAAELVRLEGALGLERRAAVLGDVLVGHGCGGDGGACERGGEVWQWRCLFAEGIYLSLRRGWGRGCEKAEAAKRPG